MSKQDKNILTHLSKTELLKDSRTKEKFSEIIMRAFLDATNEEEEQLIGALALKYELDCADEIIDVIEIEGFKQPF